MNAIIDKLKGMVPGFVTLIFSKRAVSAAVTAFFVTHAEDYGVPTESAMAVAGIVIALILGDSVRPINPDKISD